MIKKQIIAPTLLFATILLGGLVGCSDSSKSPEAVNPDASGTKVSQSTTTPSSSKPDSAERAQKREEMLKKIEPILKPDQVKQLKEKLQKGEKLRKALYSLDLSPDQKTKIQDIFKAAYPNSLGEGKSKS